MSDRSFSDRSTRKLRLGLPKGSLQETTGKLFALAGYDLRTASRSYYPEIDDPEIECILIRPQEMARYIEQGVIDCGITGLDWILETGAEVVELADLKAPWRNYVPVRWVLAVKNGSEFETPADLQADSGSNSAPACANWCTRAGASLVYVSAERTGRAS